MHILEANLKSKLPQVLATVAATVGSITDGLQYGWSSPVVPKLLSPESPVQIEEAHIAWIESLYMIGGIAGLPVTIFLVSKIGRKYSILLAAVAHLIAWALLAFAINVEMIFAGRFITGMAADIAFVAVPMYIAELSDKNIRGLLTGFIYLATLIGIIIVYSVGPYVEIYVLSVIGGAFDVLQLLSLSFLPRSPYYLLIKKHKDGAKEALQFFRGTEDVDTELAEIAAAVERQQNEKGRPVDLVLDKGNRKALIIMTVLNASQHFGSLSVMLMNIHTILYDAATIIDANMAAYVFSVVQFVAAVCALGTVDKYGRRSLLIVSSFLTGISLALLATYFAVRDSGVDVSAYNWLPVASVLLYAAAFRCGLGIVPIVMTGELFSTKMKAIGMTTADAMYVIFGTISIFLYQELSSLYGLYCPFYIFAGCCVLTALFAIFYIPETNKKTLEEIQLILKGMPNENDRNKCTNI